MAMTQSLDYERRVGRRPSRLLTLFANATLAYPLLLHGAIYGQWLLSWMVLGHRPQPSVDDPTGIDGASWMHPVTWVALMACIPVAFAAVAMNAVYVAKLPGGARRLRRLFAVAVLWVGTFLLLRWDPGLIWYWWLD